MNGSSTADRQPKARTIVPVILSGGSGTRLWPMSRTMFPKQFIKGLDGHETSLLGAALRRLPSSRGFTAPLILTNADYRFLVEEEVTGAGLAGATIVLEPIQRNTAPAIAVAAVMAMADDPDAVIAVMPSDQAIPDAARFADAVVAAAEVARTGRHVLFAITPDSPHTGYGYIRRGRPLAGATGVFEVDEFLEKPPLEKATLYVADGSYAWNSGIFVLHAATFLSDLDALSPDIVAAAEASVTAATRDLGFARLDPEAFARSPGISVDYAVMEKTKLAAVMPLDIAWSDVGSWSSLWDISPKDDCGNAGDGRAILTDSTGCLIRSARPVVATIGVHDLVIVDTPDALLVADRGRAQDVGKLAALLKSQQRRESDQHVVSHRPWGHFETLSLGDRFQVKRLHVKPGAKLSLQMHHHRSEHWVVVQGTAKVTVGEAEQLLRENESVYIVATQWHRLENPGKVPLELIEVQIGTYLGEDDIIRSDDVYNRAPSETK